MEESIRLGRIAGVRIGLNWSVIVLFALIAWALATGRLPHDFPGHSPEVYWLAATVTAGVFFVCLLAHEMGHAVAARRDGVEVEGITLWLLGGVAKLRGDTLDAQSELRIAVAGPLVSLVLSTALFGLGRWMEDAGSSPLVAGVTVWLGRINALLAAFNLVPAFPLDGGRVLRALLWRRHDRRKATAIAAWAGRAFAIILVVVGMSLLVAARSLEGAWLLLLGVFLLDAARVEQSRVVLREALEGVRVEDIMSSPVVESPDGITVTAFLEDIAAPHRFARFPVRGSAGGLVGVVQTERARSVPADRRAGTRVGDIAVALSDVAVTAPEERVADLLDRLPGRFSDWALVLSGGELVGVVSPSDLARAIESRAA